MSDTQEPSEQARLPSLQSTPADLVSWIRRRCDVLDKSPTGFTSVLVHYTTAEQIASLIESQASELASKDRQLDLLAENALQWQRAHESQESELLAFRDIADATLVALDTSQGDPWQISMLLDIRDRLLALRAPGGQK